MIFLAILQSPEMLVNVYKSLPEMLVNVYKSLPEMVARWLKKAQKHWSNNKGRFRNTIASVALVHTSVQSD